MRLVAMVSWWGETGELLSSCFEGLARLGVTHCIAVDGVLDLYPGGPVNSYVARHSKILALGAVTGIDVLLYRNDRRWGGNEVGKRQFMLDLALAMTTDHDWLLIWDTDYVLLNDELGLKAEIKYSLASTNLNYADVSYGEDIPNLYKARLFMRARRGLHLRTNHYIYWGPNGDQSWFLGTGDEAQALQLRHVRVHHNRELRPEERLKGRTVFYERRDKGRVEY